MERLRNFKQLGKEDVELAGGKGASLGEMTRADIPVPPGFVVLSNAFEKFLEETDLGVEIDSILHSVNHQEIHTIENASEKIKALILGAEIPRDIAAEIQKFFKNLDSEYVAVRSSATAEDSASAAWAGQLESYLNTTEKNLLENVKKCWASLFTPRAIFYRFEKDLHKQKISVAVVVQKMVESERSGIAFSVHPVTQDRNQLIIEAGLGLGEAIVSGQITPDSYVVEKQPRRIIDKNVQTQTKGLYRAKNGGNEWRDIPKEQSEKRVLSDKEILELSEIVLKIENHYSFPCDIEWAFEGGRFYIVQSRPITTLSRAPIIQFFEFEYQREAPISLFYVWFYGHLWAYKNLLDMDPALAEKVFAINHAGIWQAYTQENNLTKIKKRINEINKKVLSEIIESYIKEFYIFEEKNDLVLNKDFIGRLVGKFVVVFILGDMEKHPLQKDALKARVETEKLFYLFWDALKNLVKDKRNFPLYSYDEIVSGTKVSNNILSKRHNSLLTFSGVIPLKDERVELVNYLDSQHLRLIVKTDKLVFEKSITRDWPLFIVEMLHKGFIDEFQKQMGFRYSEVLFDIYSDHLDIYRVPAEHIEKMRAFILSKLADDPKFISKCSKSLFGYYKEFLEIIGRIDKGDLTKLSNQKLATMLKDFIEAHTKLEPTFVINFWFPIQMENHPEKTRWDKEISIAAKTRAETEKVGPEGDRIARKFTQEISKRMFGDEKYSKFISLSEAYDFLLNGKLLNENEVKKRMNGFVFGTSGIKFTTVDKYAELEGYEIKKVEVGEGKIVKGNVAYPGVVRGRVRIVISKEKIGIVEEGDVLVTAMTTPEFMPALKKAVAFVTDEGGITSHAAIVSRELKKPCIIGTKVATQVLKDGNLVEVDANAGVVRILE